jgi:hypothetical protein
MGAPEDDTPADGPAGDDAGSDSMLDQALESLKRPHGDADESSVTSEAPTRMNWSSVTDTEPDTPPRPDPETDPRPAVQDDPSFRFDLGSALARLGGESPDDRASGADTDGSSAQSEPGRGDKPAASSSPAAELPRRSPPQEHSADLPQRSTSPIQDPTVDRPRRPTPPIQEPTVELPRRPTSPSPQSAPEAAPGLPQRTPPEPVADLPKREPTADDPLPRRQPPAQTPPSAPAASAAPTAPRAPAAPTTPATPDPIEPAFRPSGPANSVFADAAPAPTLPTQASTTAHVEPAAPFIPPGAVANLPTLPAPVPIAPAPVPQSSSSPAAPDIQAVRSYQLKAQREQRRGRLFARTLLALFLLGGAVAAALTLGKSYLFPTEWDSALTPIVNQIQEERGGEFVETVPLDVLPAQEYAPIVLELDVGTEWADRMPEWRALGVASGSADSADISAAVVAWRPAIFDPVTNKIIQVADGEPEATEAALTLALEEVYERQHGATPNDSFEAAPAGVLGVSSLEAINSRAIDRDLLGGPGVFEINPEAQVPLPLVYQWSAHDTLGGPLVAAAGPEAATWSYGGTYPDDVLTATDVRHALAVAGPPPDGTESLAEPVSLGIDNWSLIWRNRLPERTVERLATLVTADAYRPVQRGSTQCFVGTFETGSETATADLLGSLSLWVSNGPVGAGATATLVAPTQIELFSCDPGVEAGYVVDPSAVTAILATQVARL